MRVAVWRTTIERMGLTFDKILVILVIAVFLIGPERLPGYAKKLGELVRSVKRMADGAKDRLQEELGDEVEWKQLDPRQYDPRRIIRDALAEDEREAAAEKRRARARAASTGTIGGSGVAAAGASSGAGESSVADVSAGDASVATGAATGPCFDDEAT